MYMYGNYVDSNVLGLKVVSLVERSNIQCPFFRGSLIRGFIVEPSTATEMPSLRYRNKISLSRQPPHVGLLDRSAHCDVWGMRINLCAYRRNTIP